jgi:uncharacterized membrane protein SirB2
MLKSLHVLTVYISFFLFIGRVALSVFKAEFLELKALKIAPHAVNGVLILTGVSLVFANDWLDGEYGWIVSKFILLLVYIALGILTFKLPAPKRWFAAGGAILCFVGILVMAITKSGFF